MLKRYLKGKMRQRATRSKMKKVRDCLSNGGEPKSGSRDGKVVEVVGTNEAM